jgi:hypothetical protein
MVAIVGGERSASQATCLEAIAIWIVESRDDVFKGLVFVS